MEPSQIKTLTLVRHGKSSWEHDVIDRERPLKKRGINDAKLVAEAFIKSSTLPKYVYSSPANRALSTCKIFMKSFGIPEASITVEEKLYDFSGEMVMDFIKNLPDTQNEVIIFGHNHAFTAITNLLGTTYIDNLPTSGLVKFAVPKPQWKNIAQCKNELMIIPKDLK